MRIHERPASCRIHDPGAGCNRPSVCIIEEHSQRWSPTGSARDFRFLGHQEPGPRLGGPGKPGASAAFGVHGDTFQWRRQFRPDAHSLRGAWDVVRADHELLDQQLHDEWMLGELCGSSTTLSLLLHDVTAYTWLGARCSRPPYVSVLSVGRGAHAEHRCHVPSFNMAQIWDSRILPFMS